MPVSWLVLVMIVAVGPVAPLPGHDPGPPDARHRCQPARGAHGRRADGPHHRAVTHVLSGALAGIAGMMLVLRLGSAIPSIGEAHCLLPSFAAPAIGGTLLTGGAVYVFGTVLGGLLVGTIENGLNLLAIPNFWVQLVTGLVLLLAVLLDRARTVAVERSRITRGSACTSQGRWQQKAPRRPWERLLGLAGWSSQWRCSLLEPNFLVEFNLYTLTYNVSLAVLIAFAQMVVVATGGMNLSIGGIGGLSAIIAAGLMQSYGVPIPAVTVVGLAAGLVMGAINGFLTVKTGINPFIITLATLAAYTGAIYGITSANPYYSIARRSSTSARRDWACCPTAPSSPSSRSSPSRCSSIAWPSAAGSSRWAATRERPRSWASRWAGRSCSPTSSRGSWRPPPACCGCHASRSASPPSASAVAPAIVRHGGHRRLPPRGRPVAIIGVVFGVAILR